MLSLLDLQFHQLFTKGIMYGCLKQQDLTEVWAFMYLIHYKNYISYLKIIQINLELTKVNKC